jgi:branched-chain amino acid transport system permease protein
VGAIGLFLQRCFDGLANGAIYSSLAIALVIVYRSTGLLNVAQGEVATVSTYVGLVAHTPVTPALAGTGFAHALLPGAPWPIWASILGAVVFGAALSAGAERLVIRRIPDRSGMTVVSATVGLLLLLNGFSERVWKGVVRGFPSAFPNQPRQYVLLHDARLRYTTIGTWLTLLAVLGALWLVLHFTRIGLAFRAVSSSTEMSELMGIHAGRVTTLGWALAGAIGALAGCLVAPNVLLEPGMMVRVLIFSLVAATLGGLDSLGGAVLGGLVVGVTQTMLGGYVPFVGSQLSLPGALLVMVAILVFRPTGLFGTRKIERV